MSYTNLYVSGCVAKSVFGLTSEVVMKSVFGQLYLVIIVNTTVFEIGEPTIA